MNWRASPCRRVFAWRTTTWAYALGPSDIDTLMRLTGPEVGLLFDAGRTTWAAVNRSGAAQPGDRVCHVHFKDVRKPVVQLARNLWSFSRCVINGTFTVPGDGDIDFGELLDVLLAPTTTAGWW